MAIERKKAPPGPSAEDSVEHPLGALAELVVRAAVVLRPRVRPSRAVTAMAAQQPARRRYRGRAELTGHYGARPEDVERVRAFARAHGLEVVAARPEGRLVVLRASLAALTEAFAHELEEAVVAGRSFRRRKHPIRLPPELEVIAEGVFGLDNLPSFLRASRAELLAGAATDAPAAADAPSRHEGMEPAAVRRRYRFPRGASGRGRTIAILVLGGGFYREDLERFFGRDMPEVEVVEVGGARNDPAPKEAVGRFLDELDAGHRPSGDPELLTRIWWTLETTVDIELAGSFAPGARLAVYFSSNDELGKIEGLEAVLTDAERRPDVLSCSWGRGEASLDPVFARTVDRLLMAAALRGISVCYASGDRGANLVDGRPSAHFPATSPHVLACGGTILAGGPEVPEEVWNESRKGLVLASGGGFSRFFRRPSWQRGVPPDDDGRPRRGVPDVAAKADYAGGYRLWLAGRSILGGGTSAAAPLWAGLLACLAEASGVRPGWITPLLYRPELAATLTDCTRGDNGHASAAPGWDPVTGWGTPDGEALLAALREKA